MRKDNASKCTASLDDLFPNVYDDHRAIQKLYLSMDGFGTQKRLRFHQGFSFQLLEMACLLVVTFCLGHFRLCTVLIRTRSLIQIQDWTK